MAFRLIPVRVCLEVKPLHVLNLRSPPDLLPVHQTRLRRTGEMCPCLARRVMLRPSRNSTLDLLHPATHIHKVCRLLHNRTPSSHPLSNPSNLPAKPVRSRQRLLLQPHIALAAGRSTGRILRLSTLPRPWWISGGSW